MKHFATGRFWSHYSALLPTIRALADKNFDILRADPWHPSLHFKKVGRFWSARVGRGHRALAVLDGEDLLWFWIGAHDEYQRLLGE